MTEKILFTMPLSPGDAIVAEMAIRSLHICFPGKYQTDYQGTGEELFHHHPLIKRLDRSQCRTIRMHYHEALNDSHARPIHFATAYLEHIAKELNEPSLKLRVIRPYLYLSEDEMAWKPPVKKYCVLVSGGKNDCRTKIVGRQIMQEVADHCLHRGITPVQIGSTGPNHHHLVLDGAMNLIGRTDIRQLMMLVYHSAFTVSGITMLMHLGAAFGKPGIVYHAGREPTHFTAYPKHVSLSTIGLLECCRNQGCWRSHVDVEKADRPHYCSLPVVQEGETVAGCMALLGSEPAIVAIDRFIAGGLV